MNFNIIWRQSVIVFDDFGHTETQTDDTGDTGDTGEACCERQAHGQNREVTHKQYGNFHRIQFYLNFIDQLISNLQSSQKMNGVTSTSNSNPISDKQERDSLQLGRDYFDYILKPVNADEFMSEYWEKNPLCVNRSQSDFYKQLISVGEIDEMLRTNMVEYTKNIDVTSYVDGVRETHNPEGRATPPSVWDAYGNGCSIRLLNPQTFLPNIRKLNAALQEYFHCMAGANVYLTPPNSQGFAPHFDDIEAFVLQVEGKKTWRLYAPRTESEMLARESSGNFSPDEIGEPILEKTLEAGDLLYFPRGTIHEARTVAGSHSLHITLSVYQKTSFGDLMEILLPQALSTAIQSDIEFRRGLPLNIWREFGLIRSKTESRDKIAAKLKNLFGRIFQHADLDSAVDQMALKYQHDALPPELTTSEKAKTVYGTQTRIGDDGELEEINFEEDTEVRLLRANIIRLVPHEESLRIYFYSDNSKEYHEYEQNYIEAYEDMKPAIECLIKSYPKYVRLDQLPLSLNENTTLVYELWGRGVLMTREPLQSPRLN